MIRSPSETWFETRNSRANSTAVRPALWIFGVAVALVLQVVANRPAAAASLSVQLACANDYYANCARHDPDSSAARACMRANGPKLSQRCLNALVSAGEVSKTEVARRSASGK